MVGFWLVLCVLAVVFDCCGCSSGVVLICWLDGCLFGLTLRCFVVCAFLLGCCRLVVCGWCVFCLWDWC